MDITSQSTFCDTCHEMEEYYDSWELSSHSGTDCIACHSEPSLTGYMEVKISGLRQVWVHTTGNIPEAIRADQQKINCINCHQDKPRSNEEQAALEKDPHTKMHFDDLKMTCTSCHSGVTHNADLNTKRPDRSSCLNCHFDGSMQ